MKIYYRRKFDAAHKLGNKIFSQKLNEETFGKCLQLHGHSWFVTFIVNGKKSSETGMVVNFNLLKNIIDVFDHKFINDFIELPTAENLVDYYMERLISLNSFSYINVRVEESDNAYAEDEYGEL